MKYLSLYLAVLMLGLGAMSSNASSQQTPALAHQPKVVKVRYHHHDHDDDNELSPLWADEPKREFVEMMHLRTSLPTPTSIRLSIMIDISS